MKKLETQVITNDRSERSSNYQSYISRLNDVETVLRLLKRNFMNILKLAESHLKTINRPSPPDPSRPDPNVTLFDGLFFGKY